MRRLALLVVVLCFAGQAMAQTATPTPRPTSLTAGTSSGEMDTTWTTTFSWEFNNKNSLSAIQDLSQCTALTRTFDADVGGSETTAEYEIMTCPASDSPASSCEMVIPGPLGESTATPFDMRYGFLRLRSAVPPVYPDYAKVTIGCTSRQYKYKSGAWTEDGNPSMIPDVALPDARERYLFWLINQPYVGTGVDSQPLIMGDTCTSTGDNQCNRALGVTDGFQLPRWGLTTDEDDGSIWVCLANAGGQCPEDSAFTRVGETSKYRVRNSTGTVTLTRFNTASQNWIYTAGSGNVQFDLPDAEDGLAITITNGSAQNVTINPFSDDRIWNLTDGSSGTGDAIQSTSQGDTVSLVAYGASSWYPTSVVGSWADVN